MKNIPVSWPFLDNSEIKIAKKVLDEGWLGLGKYVTKFESEISKYLNLKNKYVSCVSTGTDAIFMGLLLAGVKKGDEVILPSLNFIAGPQSVILSGAKPVFCDVEEDTLCIDLKKAEKLITKKTKAIISVDYSGNQCDYIKLNKIKKKYNLRIVQDAAHSFASIFSNGKKLPSHSDIVVFSFDAIKTITTIDGGAIIVNNKKDDERIKSMRQLGFSTQPNVAFSKNQKMQTDVKYLGMQNRMSNLHAAIGLSQLKKLNSIVTKKKIICKNYYKNLKNNKFIKIPHFKSSKMVPFIYYIQVPSKYRDKLRKYLKRKNILTGLHWYPNHRFTVFKSAKKGNLGVTNKVSSQLITIPLFYKLTANEQKYICNQINNFFKHIS